MKYELMIETKDMIKINVFSHTREGLNSAFEKIWETKNLISAIIFSERDGEVFRVGENEVEFAKVENLEK